MSIRISNDNIRNKLQKVASGLQAIQKCLGRGQHATKSILKKGRCPPANSAIIVSELNKASLDKMKQINNEVKKLPLIKSSSEDEEKNYKRKTSRSWSVSDGRLKNEIDIKDFPSSQTTQKDMYGSNKSINSIFRLHQTLNTTRSRSNSESSLNLPQKKYKTVSVYRLFQSKDSSNRPIRPNSLYISQRNSAQNQMKPVKQNKNTKQSCQSLDKYLSTLSKVESKEERSEKAAEALDSCILLMMNLINDM